MAEQWCKIDPMRTSRIVEHDLALYGSLRWRRVKS